MKERLTRCLQLLKINHDDQISKTAFELIEKSNDQAMTTMQDRDWINALNAIAGSCILNQRVLSQSEIRRLQINGTNLDDKSNVSELYRLHNLKDYIWS